LQIASVVIGSTAQRIQVEHNHFAAWHYNITIGGKPADTIIGTRRQSVIEINEMISVESRIESDSEQAPFT
jgi:hypothetical protein